MACRCTPAATSIWNLCFAEDNGQGTDLGEGNGAILDACLENAGACAGTGYVYCLCQRVQRQLHQWTVGLRLQQHLAELLSSRPTITGRA